LIQQALREKQVMHEKPSLAWKVSVVRDKKLFAQKQFLSM
jgi:hypothetical protein